MKEVTKAILSEQAKKDVWEYINKARKSVFRNDFIYDLIISLAKVKVATGTIELDSKVFEIFKNNCIDLNEYLTEVQIKRLCVEFEAVVSFCLNNIIPSYSPKGYSLVEEMQPKELTLLCSELLNLSDGECVYNPFAGLGSYAIYNPQCNFEGEEISERTWALMQINLAANNCNSHFKIENSFVELSNTKKRFDAVLMTPPFGLKGDIHETSAEAVLKAVENKLKPGGRMIAVLPINFCSSRDTFHIRKDLVSKGYIKSVIALPAIFKNSVVRTCILFLTKEKNEETLFFDFKSFISISDAYTDPVLNYKSILECIENGDQQYFKEVHNNELFKHSLDLNPVKKVFSLPKSEWPTIKLIDILEISRPEFVKNTIGNVFLEKGLSTNPFMCEISKAKLEDKSIPMGRVFKGKHIIVHYAVNNGIRFAKFDSDRIGKVTIADRAKGSLWVFQLKTNSIDTDFLLWSLRSAFVQCQVDAFATGTNLPRLSRQDFLDISIPVPSFDEQRRIIETERRKFLDQMGVVQTGTDLAHMLGTPFTKIATAFAYLKDNNSFTKEDENRIAYIKKLFDYADRMVKASGNIETIIRKNTPICLYSFLEEYVNTYAEIGSHNFRIELDGDADAKKALVKGNQLALSIMFDCLLDNANRHGFGKQYNESNEVSIFVNSVTIDEKPCLQFRVSNNGRRMPEGFDVERFTRRGNFELNSGRSGIGGYHINCIMESMGGKIMWIMSTPELTSIEFQVPEYELNIN